MADTFQNLPYTLESPARKASAVVFGEELDPTPRALWVGSAGNLVVTMLDGGNVTFSGIQAGSVLPIRVRRVLSGTAGAVVGLV